MKKIDWNFCQQNSNLILADGIIKLGLSQKCKPHSVDNNSAGNYLITYNEKPCYIGEAKNIKARLKQQYRIPTSTFYKNYLKENTQKVIDIHEYEVKFISTQIGRKEIEDFGIVNLATHLNKFQINKRQKHELIESNIWIDVQTQKNIILNQGETVILNSEFTTWQELTVESTPGIYIIKLKNNIIYIGESSNIKERHKTHCSQTYFSALRRHIGTVILNYTLKEKNGKKKYFNETEDKNVTALINQTTALFLPVSFGRYEFEEYLIKKHKPLLNVKDNF